MEYALAVVGANLRIPDAQSLLALSDSIVFSTAAKAQATIPGKKDATLAAPEQASALAVM